MNYANSIIDVKGNGAIIWLEIVPDYQNGNSLIVDPFQLHEIVRGWGITTIYPNEA